MLKQILFSLSLLLTLGVFSYSTIRYIRFFSLTKKGFPVQHLWKRFGVLLNVAIGQSKIFRFPFTGILHAVVFWGFCLIIFGSIEMVIDGLTGSDRILSALGPVYDFITGSGDIFALLISFSILVFLGRRLFYHVNRFDGAEMKHWSHIDARIALSLIFWLMVTLLGMNMAYVSMRTAEGLPILGIYPVSNLFLHVITFGGLENTRVLYEVFWWSHILLIFLFANILPYSKHFHVFMSLPNVFLSRLEPLGKLRNMDEISREVRFMLDPAAAAESSSAEPHTGKFGVKDVEDLIWKNYLDSLSCTQCGRCTSVCPANITGKKLSPRKIMMDVRARMKEKGPLMIINGKEYSDKKALLRDYISVEELWACTTCNACSKECPINIHQPSIILDMRRYLVMEEAAAPGLLNTMFNNIENNGAPWQFSREDRLNWAKDLNVRTGNS